MAIPASTPRERVRIWDLPVRLFHWVIVVLIALAWWTAENDQLRWHLLIGDAIAGLLVFRLCWGLFGSSTARFSHFLKGPNAVARYAAGLFRRPAQVGPPGHNPMGGWSVVALLALMAAIVGLGLFSVDVDATASGPLADHVSFDHGRVAAHWHHLLFDGLLAFIALHLLAIAFYTLAKRDNLVGPMITGRKSMVEGGGLRSGRWPLLLFAAGLGVVVAAFLLNGAKI